MPHDSLITELEHESRGHCIACGHNCHCDTIVCSTPVGVGMTDKNQPCACPACKCS